MAALSIQDDTAASNAVLAAGRFVLVILLFTISTSALVMFGWQYDDTGGGALEKLHPATWLAVALFALMISLDGNPLKKLIRIAEEHTDILPFLFGILFMIFYAVRVMGAPFTIFIETFLGPLILFLLFSDIAEREARRLAWLIHFLLLCNALLGIYEFATAWRMTPLVVNGEELTDELRSTAFFGHPLANAAVVGCYVLIMALGGRRDIPSILALALFTINAASMIVFGGRAATALVIVALLAIGLVRLVGIMRGQPFRLHALRTALIAIPLYSLLIAILAEYNFFDAFLDRISDDEGSASTRVAMFSIFEHMSWFDLIFLPDAKQVGTWMTLYGLNYGIENFVVAFVLSFGLLATVVFLPTLLLFCRAVTRTLEPKASWVFVYFFIVALTSVSLSAKSPLLSVIIVMLTVLMRRPQLRA